ncbi:gametocyte-specific factor 1-like isoform X2 [Polyodon spathula]|uniref:gametocyte-specific factor 1-like isoform X2 n=2 Tax=Polyodon spathula TaxID=7913 RepID=UPI001B7DC568|nr:gametocyte-specific factor 1-like isoform X2 [Polyodon spathula]
MSEPRGAAFGVEADDPPGCRPDREAADMWNPDKLLQCPYDKNHLIRALRFPYHLVKCSKNHPKLAQELKSCPFNARHLLPRSELSHHIANCVDRCIIGEDSLVENAHDKKWQVPVSTWQNPSVEEDWDEEVDNSSCKPFVWGIDTVSILESRPEPSASSSLPAGLRVPRTLPWKNCKCRF